MVICSWSPKTWSVFFLLLLFLRVVASCAVLSPTSCQDSAKRTWYLLYIQAYILEYTQLRLAWLKSNFFFPGTLLPLPLPLPLPLLRRALFPVLFFFLCVFLM